MPLAVTIAGTARTAYVDYPSLRITWASNYRTVCEFTTFDDSASPFRPAIGDAVTVADGDTLFAGLIQALDVERAIPHVQGARCRVSCVDYSAYPTYRWVRAQSFAAGQTTKQVLTSLVSTYLSEWSIAVDSGMGAGTALAATNFDGRTLDDVFTELASAEGWIWEIVDVTGTKTLKAYAPGTTGAPASFTESDTNLQKARWTQRRDAGGYANRVIVRWGSGGTDEVSSDASASTDPHEALITAPEITNSTQAAALADAHLARRLTTDKEVLATTKLAGYRPGQSVTINLPTLGVSSATYYIREVVAGPFKRGTDTLYYDVTCVTSSAMPGDWRSFYSGAFGSYSESSAASMVFSTTQGRSYDLGGSRYTGIKYNASTPVPEYLEVVLDSSWFSGATVTAQVECKTAAAGTSVQPQVWNVTDNAQAGIGSATTQTSWEAQSFAITLATGVKRYRLHLIPQNATNLVYGIGALYAS